MRKLLTVVIGALLCTAPLAGSDATTAISQATLTAYAVSSGINTGSQIILVTAVIWQFRCTDIQCSTTGPYGHGPCICVSGTWVPIPIVLWSETVNWAVVSPAFTISPQGISFTGMLENTRPGVPSASQAFTLPATASFGRLLRPDHWAGWCALHEPMYRSFGCIRGTYLLAVARRL